MHMLRIFGLHNPKKKKKGSWGSRSSPRSSAHPIHEGYDGHVASLEGSAVGTATAAAQFATGMLCHSRNRGVNRDKVLQLLGAERDEEVLQIDGLLNMMMPLPPLPLQLLPPLCTSSDDEDDQSRECADDHKEPLPLPQLQPDDNITSLKKVQSSPYTVGMQARCLEDRLTSHLPVEKVPQPETKLTSLRKAQSNPHTILSQAPFLEDRLTSLAPVVKSNIHTIALQPSCVEMHYLPCLSSCRQGKDAPISNKNVAHPLPTPPPFSSSSSSGRRVDKLQNLAKQEQSTPGSSPQPLPLLVSSPCPTPIDNIHTGGKNPVSFDPDCKLNTSEEEGFAKCKLPHQKTFRACKLHQQDCVLLTSTYSTQDCPTMHDLGPSEGSVPSTISSENIHGSLRPNLPSLVKRCRRLPASPRSSVLQSRSSGASPAHRQCLSQPDSHTSVPANLSPRPTLPPKTMCPRKWTKGAMLGRGSFGTVYEGMNQEDGSFFAVKISSRDDVCPETQQEIVVLSKLEHPNIVRYLGSSIEEGRLCIFLELVRMGSLEMVLQKYNRFEDNMIRSYTRQILYGLEYLHEKKTIHRDIKCGNILVDVNGQVKLSDFGVAKQVGDCLANSVKGTPLYMAPEVLTANKSCYSFPADIWSLGCTVLEMADGKPPWSDLQGFAFYFKVKNGELPYISNHLSEEGKDFVRRCLKLKPGDRPTASELLMHPFIANMVTPDHHYHICVSQALAREPAPSPASPRNWAYENLCISSPLQANRSLDQLLFDAQRAQTLLST